jgi:hypothetical protein
MDVSLSTADDRARPGARLAHELRGAATLVLSGIAIRVVHCGHAGREVEAALAEVADLADLVPIRTEYEAPDRYSVVVGPLRA